jgi:hypothetical protein
MRKLSLIFALIFVCLPAVAQNGQGSGSENGKTELNLPEPPMLGQHWAKGGAPPFQGPKSPDMTSHGGDIMTDTVTAAIFWGTSWSATNYKVSGMDDWYRGVNGTDYAKTSDEYSGPSGYVGPLTTYAGHFIDNSAAPSRAPSTSAVLAEVCNTLKANAVDPVSKGYYAVYVDTKRRNANYCAWHSWSSCTDSHNNSVPVQFAFFFNLDDDSGCDPQDSTTGNPQGLAALGNVTGHEFSEARTDPRGSAWYDSQGAENADKCAWRFGSDYVVFPKLGNTTITKWKIQGNWSNAAYDASPQTGYANSSGQKGCIDGGNYK